MSSIYDQLGDACKQFGKRVGMAIKEANDLMATYGKKGERNEQLHHRVR